MNVSRANPRRKPASLQATFASNVLLHRTRLGITQEELAELAGYHRTYIGSVERAERNITLATIEAFALAFSVKPYEMLVPKDD